MIKKALLLPLLAIVLVSCGQANSSKPAQGGQSEAVAPASASIVYVNIDSLVQGYQMYKDLNAEFVKKAEGIQKEFDRRGAAFQKNATSYQQKMQNGLLTRMDAAKEEEKLQQQQQQLLQYRDEVVAGISEEEAVMINKIKFAIQEYINKYNAEKKYDLIISTSMATGIVLAGNPSLDITADVLKGLNAEYVPAAPAKK